MTMSRPRFRVQFVDSDEVHDFECIAGDQLRAETQARKEGLPSSTKDAPQNHTALWAWQAMVRLKLYHQPFQQFVDDLYAFEEVQGGAVDVDPTEPEPSSSDSSSPASTETPDSGSTLTSTST